MNFIHFDSIDSTNTFLKKYYDEFKNGFIVYTNHQSSGRGRMGRTWVDDEGSLMFSILLKNNIDITWAPKISLSCAISINKVLNELGIFTLIKWPNDIVYNDKKIVGILTESIIEKEKVKAVIVGIGINLNNESFSDEIKEKATSIYKISSKKYDKELILQLIYNKIMSELKTKLLDVSYLNDYLSIKNKKVNAIINGKSQEVKAIKVLENGMLLVNDTVEDLIVSSNEVTLTNNY